MNERLTIEEAHQLSVRALCRHNTSTVNAEAVARALVAAEADGLSGHGLSRLPAYCQQADSGKVAGHATPEVSQVAAAALRIDAMHGFAFPALEIAVSKLSALVPQTGIGVVAVTRSHHCGAAGYHVEALARQNLVGLLFANTPKAISPWGGRHALFGTNPIAFAAPRRANDPLVIDLSLSKVARGKIMVAEQKGEPIPEGWALDTEGRPTTDAKAALEGTMLPMGEAKGAALVLMVEILAAALTAASFGFEAGSFFTAEGPPPGVGQLLIAVAPGPLSGQGFESRLEVLLKAVLDQGNTRLPGDRRLAARRIARTEGLSVDERLLEKIRSLAASS
jgi:(2R)-3-sulfolactate dehydrogenase (NADP+)